jgi:hypothetical protein
LPLKAGADGDMNTGSVPSSEQCCRERQHWRGEKEKCRQENYGNTVVVVVVGGGGECSNTALGGA